MPAAFTQEAIEPESTIHTDGWSGYNGLKAAGYQHDVTNLKRSEELAHELMPRVHRVAPLLKRWLLGTHQGAVSREHKVPGNGWMVCSKVWRIQGFIKTQNPRV
jgi:hypothetical protein